tara:strand:- start:4609 stop:5391 length:783 start_codon:yes stop_codon:yes gene_type:complete
MGKRRVASSKVTLRAGEKNRQDEHVWNSPPMNGHSESLGVRITKGYYGLTDARYNPISTTVEFFFDENEDLVLRFGQNLNPYLNRIMVSPPLVRIPAALLKFKSYGVDSAYTRANLYGDFIFIWGEKKRRINYFAINVSAVCLLDGLGEICLDGTFQMFREAIGKLDPKQGNLCPFFISGEVDHGEQFELFKQFERDSYGVAHELTRHRTGFLDYPLVTKFLNVYMGSDGGRDGIPPPRETLLEQAREAFEMVFPLDKQN